MSGDEALFFDEKSIDRERIVTDKHHILNELFCPICFGLLWKPRSCASCQNLFCNKCIQTWLNVNSTTCPLCRCSYEEKPAPPSIQSIVSYFVIRCRNNSLGCKEILPYDLLEQHESIDCSFLTKKCRVCEEVVFVADIDQHKNVCKPIVVQCPSCQCFVKRELFEVHQDECLQELPDEYERFAEELLTPFSLSTGSVVDFAGMEMFTRSREKNCLIRFWGTFQLIFVNLPMIHLILFNLFGWGCGTLIHTLENFFLYLQTWIRTSVYQTYMFILIFSVILHYCLPFLLISVNDIFIILFIIFSLIIWSSISSKIEVNQFQMDFNLKEMLLFYILIILLLEMPLLIIRLYFEYVPINIGAICFAFSIISFPKFFHRSVINRNSFTN